ncbi:Salivary glue protein Sgs-3 precursor, putative [Brugia malayi]|uniref:Salivary glue protein Sgs-3, putative n=1 Tax=Brugia malayi TaxID=6279 RepID=A0A4E9F402_BRUMA|nr:Salivary glue protein Sgs-3 precursor, putative [Brugia malayi]VIO89928.1 Salivary glue protein Sgs-3 precursor, putative [Brugia malayi]
MTSTITMNDDLLDNYNPLYDVHLRQYFAMPHMQRHLRNIGLLDDIRNGENEDNRDSNKQRHTMIDKMLRNREAELQKYADLQRKLHAAEKIEICRRIRSGTASPSDCHRAKPSRSLSRGRYIKRSRRRRSSASIDDKNLVQKIEAENEEPMYENPSLVYNRLSTNILKYRYLHKLDDETLALYMQQLRRQLSRLERFRQVSFGPFSVARHQNDPQVSWFFRRRSIQSLNQHRSRSTKPQSSRSGISDNSYVNNRLQSKRQLSTDNNTRLSVTLSNVKSSGASDIIKTSRAKKTTTPGKKVAQKKTITPTTPTTTTLTGHKLLEVDDDRMKSKTDPELGNDADLKTTMEIIEHRSDESALNYDDEREMYSGITSPESIDLKIEKGAISAKSLSSMNNFSTLSINDEQRIQSTVSQQLITESEAKFKQLEIKHLESSNLSFDDLSTEISKKTEFEIADLSSADASSVISKWKRTDDEVENLMMSHRTSIDSIPNDSDSQEMILSDEIDDDAAADDDQCLAKIGMKMEKKTKQLARGQSSIDQRKITQIDSKQNQSIYHSDERLDKLSSVDDKMIDENFEKINEIISSPARMNILESKSELQTDKQSEIDNTKKHIEIPEITHAVFTETIAREEIQMDKTDTEYDVDEFVAINGEILEISSEGKLEGDDSVVISEIYSVDQAKEIPATEEKLTEFVTDDSIPVSKNSASAEKLCSVGAIEDVCYTEIEFSDDQECRNDFTELNKTEYSVDQGTEDCNVERLSKLPELISTPVRKMSESPELMPTSITETNNESFELPKSESSFEQLDDPVENEQQITADAEHLGEKIEIATKNNELESVKDLFQVEQFPEFLIDKQLKYQETTTATENKIIDKNFDAKIQQCDTDIDDHLNFNNKHQSDEKPESFIVSSESSTLISDIPVNDTSSLIEKSHSRIQDEITENMTLQEQTKRLLHEMEISEVEGTAGIEPERGGIQGILQTESEASKSPESITQQSIKSFDNKITEASNTETIVLAKPEMITTPVKGKLPESILLNPENLIIDGLTNKFEPVISGMQDVQPFILTSLETIKHETDDQINTFTLNRSITDTDHSFENNYSTENVISDKSIDKMNGTEMESDLSECIENSLISTIPRSDVSSIELNALEENSMISRQVISECSREEIEKNEILAEENDNVIISDKEEKKLSSKLFAPKDFEKISNTINSRCNEGIPKIVVCSDETTISDLDNMRKMITMQTDNEAIKQSMIIEKDNAKMMDPEYSGISTNEPEKVNEMKQSMKEQLNDFLEQYMNDIIQNIAELTDERIEKRKISKDEIEKIAKTESVVPECIPECGTQFTAMQETFHMKSMKYEEETEECNMLSDQQLLLEQSNTGAEEQEVITVNSK